MTLDSTEAKDAQSSASAADLIAGLMPLVDQAAEVRKAGTAEALLFNYVLANGKPKERNLPSLMRLLRGAIEMGYCTWPMELKGLYQGKDVLHLGCGQSLHCVAFRAFGARSYTGVDGALQLSRKKYRNRLKKETVDLGLSLVDVTRLVPGITFLRSDGITLEEAFDVVIPSMARMSDVEAELEQIHKALRSRGQIWFTHDNFYAWGGHQGEPKSPSVYDETNPEHVKYADWRHVTFDPPADHRFQSINRISVGELRRIVDRYFEVEQWKEVPDRSSVAARLTPAIRKALPGLTEQDLLTKQVICRATKRNRM